MKPDNLTAIYLWNRVAGASTVARIS